MLLHLWESGAGPVPPGIACKILQVVKPPPALKTEKEHKVNIFQLSEREKEILQLPSRGMEYREIGAAIFIIPNTVKKHCISIYQKLHVNSKVKALHIAYAKCLI
jgi:DNA-binding NarL/FixJ family response regulator